MSWCVHPANIQDNHGISLVFKEHKPDRLRNVSKVLVDRAYQTYAKEWVEAQGWELAVVKPDKEGTWVAPNVAPHPSTGFRVLKWRWVVERTFAWFGRFRRLSKDYEATIASSEAFMILASSAILLRRISNL